MKRGSLREPYITVNLVLAAVILLIMGYSALFSPEKNNYPVPCVHEKLTGKPCASCGLSHSFSLIIRGEFSEAYSWNIYGMRIFLFFLSQLLMRIVFSIIYLKNELLRRQIIIMDIAGSSIIFLIAFFPFINYLVSRFRL